MNNQTVLDIFSCAAAHYRRGWQAQAPLRGITSLYAILRLHLMVRTIIAVSPGIHTPYELYMELRAGHG